MSDEIKLTREQAILIAEYLRDDSGTPITEKRVFRAVELRAAEDAIREQLKQGRVEPTPGPWTITKIVAPGLIPYTKWRLRLGEYDRTDFDDNSTSRANVRLIAAAPRYHEWVRNAEPSAEGAHKVGLHADEWAELREIFESVYEEG